MYRCSVATAERSSKERIHAVAGASPLLGLARCGEVSLPARAAATRAAARCSAPVPGSDGCCTVLRSATQPPKQKDKVARPSFRPASNGDADAAIAGVPSEEMVLVNVLVARAVGLPQADFMGTADPYVEFRVVAGDPLSGGDFKPQDVRKRKSKAIEGKSVFTAETEVIRGTLTPTWDEIFSFQVPLESVDSLWLYFRVYDYDLITSHDFLGHASVKLLDALVSSKELSPGWRALLRSCPVLRDRVEMLRDQRLLPKAPVPCRIRPVPGQETTYDLRAAEIFIDADLPQKQRQVTIAPKNIPGVDQELLGAVAAGDATAVQAAFGRGATVNALAISGEFEGFASLHVACAKKHEDLAMALVDVYNASLVQIAPRGRSSAMCACEGGSETLAEWLIVEGVPVDLRDEEGQTVLFYAARAAMPQLVSWLVGKQRLDPGQKASDGSTPVTAAVSSGVPAAVVVARQLLEARASANAADKAGIMPLHVACKAGDDPCVQLLLGFGGASAKAVDATGFTAIDWAQGSSLPDATVQRLRELGAEEGGYCGRQRGETSDEAIKREARERKALVADRSWATWRASRPRPTDAAAGVGELGQPETARSDMSDFSDGFPSFSVRTDTSPTSSSTRPGRLGRMKAWASSLRRAGRTASTER